MADIIYTYCDEVYMNITNKCPCNCVFCVRSNNDGLGSAQTLWHDNDPTFEEIKKAVDNFHFDGYSEVVFCGYGEPLSALDNLIKTSKYLKSNYDIKIRVNTNGLGDLINKKKTAEILGEFVDIISISLNAPNSKRYAEVSQPAFGEESFGAIIDFAKDCKKHIKTVKFSIVDIISEEEIEQCQKIARELDIPLRVRNCLE
ncbi:MAG TPA: TIGR04100 family radical SAM protein [Clostridia bacterium]|nr:TIGR04100 family radical SAM protein [Clostridia bacterium]